MTDRHDLCRSVPFTMVRATETDHGDGLTLDGYAAVFNDPTRIDSWEGRFDEQIARGAFRKSLSERTPRLQFDHGYHPLIGSIPIGRITSITEDQRGLHVVARMADNWLIEPLRDAIADEAVDGMSFRFSVVRETWHTPDGKEVPAEQVTTRLWDGDEMLLRTLREVKVSEVGPVVWPAYENTTVGVRSVTIDLGSLRSDPEQIRRLEQAVAQVRATLLTTSGSVAPPDSGHPIGRDDAPPDSGHPSLSPNTPEPTPHKGRIIWPEYRERLARIKEQ